MDPLSITASVLAVLGAVGQTAKALKKLWGLKDAPEELASLVNEVHSLISAQIYYIATWPPF